MRLKKNINEEIIGWSKKQIFQIKSEVLYGRQ